MFPKFAFSRAVTRDVSVEDNTITFSGFTLANNPFDITTKLSDANEWLNGGLIQNCFPYLTSEQREILMTGNDDESWAELFGNAGEDE